MKKLFYVSALLLATGLTANAECLSPEAALGRVRENMPNRIRAISGNSAPQLLQTITDATGKPSVYLFTDRTGYMIVSAESDAQSLLAYSDEGEFSLDMMPPAMAWWLDLYNAEISWLRSNEGSSVRKSRQNIEIYDAIKPLCTTKWSQGWPYYNQTPVIGTTHCATGCVATGMAQAIKYWNYPERGQGSISFNVSHIGDLSMNFEEAVYDWEHMTDTYGSNSTQEEQDAVALLMKACGYATRMWYNTGSSGTQSSYIANAIRQYFGYDSEIAFVERNNYSPSEWTELIYNNIKNIGPVIYSGYSNIGEGHCYVADGYDGKGLFHINWGWGGQSDGYFNLSSLNPSQQGTGGSPGGFSFSQNAVVNMHPPHYKTEKGVISHEESAKATIKGTAFELTYSNNPNLIFVNNSTEAQDVTFAYTFTGVSDESFEPVTVRMEPVVHFDAGQSLRLNKMNDAKKFSFDLEPLNLPEGDYSVQLQYQLAGSETLYVPQTNVGNTNCSKLTYSGGKYKVSNVVSRKVSFVTTAEFPSELYYDIPVSFTYEVTNTGTIDASVGVAPCLLDANNNILAKNAGLMHDLDPGQSYKGGWSFDWIWDSTPNKDKEKSVYIGLYNPNDWSVLWRSEPVKIKAADVMATKVGKFTIQNAERVNGTFNILGYKDIQFYSEVYCASGNYNYPLQLSIWYKNPVTGKKENVKNIEIEEYKSLEVPFTAVGATTHLNLDNIARPGGSYYAYISYPAFNQWNHLVSRSTGKVLELPFKVDASGVDEVENDASAVTFDHATQTIAIEADEIISDIDIYSVAGARLAGVSAPGVSALTLDAPAQGVMIVKVMTESGKTISAKILN